MKNTLSLSLLVYTCFFALTTGAALYKGVDADGNVVYSDKPFESAERFTPPPISVVDSPEGRVEEKPVGEKLAEFKYLGFDIVSPVDKETIRNDPDIGVSFKITPGLNTEEGHTIWVLLDNKPVVKNAKTLSVKLGRLDRGAHRLQAQIRDKDGKPLVQTRVAVIFVKFTVK